MVAALVLAWLPRGLASAAELLPEVSLRLEAARYAPVESDLQWVGWVGAGVGLVELRGTTAYFTADVESVLGHVRRPFEASQANYHLEVGLRGRMGGLEVGPFFHHVSRHAVDRDKPQAVDWNVLGLRVSAPLTGAVRLTASAGHTTLASLVGYRWEFAATLDADLARPAYARAAVRAVTVRASADFPRGDFADLWLEAGARWRRERRALETFAAFERRNDVFLLAPGARSRLLVGFRIGYSSR